MEAPAWYFSKALTHRQKVCRLYKKALRTVDHWYMPDTVNTMHHRTVMRARFEVHRDEKDLRRARKVLMDGVKELWQKAHPVPFHFAHDPEGVAFERELPFDDMIYDKTWTPYDTGRFPDYFKLREQRKKEYLEMFRKVARDKEVKLRDHLKL